jgi:hypothetical protein
MQNTLYAIPSVLIHSFLVTLMGALIMFVGVFGFGISTQLYADFLHVSEDTNNFISFVLGLLSMAMAFYIS